MEQLIIDSWRAIVSEQRTMKEILESIAKSESDSPELLKKLVENIRPGNPENIGYAETRINFLILLLNENTALSEGLKNYLQNLIHTKNQVKAFTELGILPGQTHTFYQ